VSRDGSIRWIAGKGRVEFDDAGQPLRMDGINLDITDRKQAELQEKFRTEVLNLLAKAAPLQIILDAIVHHAESMNPDALGVILLLDTKGKRLSVGSAPHVVSGCVKVRNSGFLDALFPKPHAV
jgi:hypothetical protein